MNGLSAMPPMATSLTPEQYAQQKYHRQVRPPENCPNCQRAHVLEALAYS